MATEGLFRSLVESTRDFILVVDHDHVIRYLNHAGPGHDVAEVVGASLYDFLSNESRDIIRDSVDSAIGDGTCSWFETEITDPDAVGRSFSVRVSPLCDDGVVAAATLIATDTTELRRTERDSAAAHIFLQRSLDVIEAIVVALDRAGRITLINRAGARLLGAEQEALLGESWFDRCIPPEHLERTWAAFQRIISGEPGPAEYFENLVRTTEGERRLIAWHNAYITDDDGLVVGTLSFGEDITDKREAERALGDSKALLESIFRTAPTGIGLVVDRLILRANERICEMTGYSEGELVGQNSQILYLTQEEYERVEHEEYRQITECGTGNVETRWIAKNGENIDVLLSSTPIDLDDLSRGVTFTALDITERKRMDTELRQLNESLENLVEERTADLTRVNEELQEADTAKDEFLAAMSHELRTPLNSIIGFTGIMLDGLTGKINEEQENQLGMVRDSGKHLLTLVNDLLDLSRIEAREREMEYTEFALDDIVSVTTGLLHHGAQEKRLEIEVSITDSDAIIHTDQRAVAQILLNLVGNAIKFTNEGTVRIEAYVTDADRAVFRVSDTGIGIAKEDLDTIFERFRQVGRPACERSMGTGLGLAISSQLAHCLGGTLAAESTLGEGSVFILDIPAHGD